MRDPVMNKSIAYVLYAMDAVRHEYQAHVFEKLSKTQIKKLRLSRYVVIPCSSGWIVLWGANLAEDV